MKSNLVTISPDELIRLLWAEINNLPDKRTGTNKKYELKDAVIAAFSVFFTLWGIAILWLSFRTSKEIQGFCVQFLGIQAGISSFHQINYMFMNEAVINGRRLTSDTGQIAKQLFLPHWFWASLIIALTFWLLYTSFRIAYKDEKLS